MFEVVPGAECRESHVELENPQECFVDTALLGAGPQPAKGLASAVDEELLQRMRLNSLPSVR